MGRKGWILKNAPATRKTERPWRYIYNDKGDNGGRKRWNFVEAHDISECIGFVVNIGVRGRNYGYIVYSFVGHESGHDNH